MQISSYESSQLARVNQVVHSVPRYSSRHFGTIVLFNGYARSWSGHFAKRARSALKNDHFVRRKCEYGAGNDGEKRMEKKKIVGEKCNGDGKACSRVGLLS